MAKLTVTEVNGDIEVEGLADGGHTLLSCSSCRAILMDVWVTRPHEKEEWKVRATCPFCGDSSFVHTVKGGFHPGGFALPRQDNPDDDGVPSTVVDYPPDVGSDGVITFTIIKANQNAKPIRAKC